MIFSKLFKTKPNWQHKDTAVRVSAINDELSPDNNEQLDILLSLIQNDESDLVRRAALLKVGSFDCYLAVSQDNSQEKIKQFATKQVHDILTTDHNIVLSKQIKEDLLNNAAYQTFLNTALLEAWFANEQDNELIVTLYNKIGERKASTNNFLVQSFSQKQTPSFQTHVIESTEDVKTLEKLIKKACDESITTQIQNKLTAIQAEIEKPQKLNKKIQLTLAKLQALKDVNEYADYKRRKSQLIADWQFLEADFDVFPADEVAVFIEKYESIIAHLEKLFVVKAENYQQQIISDKLAHDKQQDKKDFTQQVNQISQAITSGVFSSEPLDEDYFKTILVKLKNDIKASVLNKSEQAVFLEQVEKLTQRLAAIPEIAESVSEATYLISKMSALSLPKGLDTLNDRQEVYNDWLKAWRKIEKKSEGILPETIVQSQKQIVSTWQSGLKALQSEQKELFFQNKKKLQDIKRLINNGKFKVCFGLFKGVKENFNLLSSQQQYQLQRDFDQVSEKMVELSDWEHYIATPRKQELLVSLQAIVDTPLDNPNEQASKVKAYRTTWNSLGHADEELDNELNDKFNNLCELAFAPCRLFYAEQDKIREQHLAARQAIIARAEQLANDLLSSQESNSVDFKKLDAKLNTLQKDWQNGGEVDRNLYKKLQQQFRSVLNPVQLALTAFQENNAQQKQILITKAKALLENDDVFTAIESAKALQKSWREVGFSGKHNESKLWQSFRVINDELFGKRQEAKSAQEAELSEQQAIYETQIADIAQSLTSLSETQDVNALSTLNNEAKALLEVVVSNKPVIKAVAVRLEKLITEIEQLSEKVLQVKTKQVWTCLFEVLSVIAQQTQQDQAITEASTFKALNSFWQKRIQESQKLTNAVESDLRLDKTLAIEILSNCESPSEFAERRMKVQVQLMQEQMVSNAEINLTQQLVDWLMLGELTSDDLPLIERLQSVYCK